MTGFILPKMSCPPFYLGKLMHYHVTFHSHVTVQSYTSQLNKLINRTTLGMNSVLIRIDLVGLLVIGRLKM